MLSIRILSISNMPTFNGPMVNPLKNPAAGIPEDNSLQLAATQTEYPRKKKNG